MVQTSCSACDNVAVTPKKRPKYCSKACRTWSGLHPGEKRPAIRPCDWCAQQMKRGGKAAKRFCSARCRGAAGQVTKACRQCRTIFRGTSAFCSPECKAVAWNKPKPCKICGEVFERWNQNQSSRHCRPCSASLVKAHNARKNAKRRGCRVGERVMVEDIARRDGWRCHLCSKPINRKTPRTAPMGATIDHLVPVSDGGTHVMSNVRLAHGRCNTLRDVGGTVQLLLIG